MSHTHLKTLMIDAANGFYKIQKYELGNFWGPVDLGIHLSHKYNSLNIGTGLLAGSIFPGSNRLIVSGISPCWHGFYISSMGGAGLIFDNLGINLLAITGKASMPSVLYLNRIHGEEIQVEIVPIRLRTIWGEGRKGVYALMEHSLGLFAGRYEEDPRVIATGPASL
ncbi:MAG: aldehyde ferredoxin oxidoreductase, partial [Bacteroidales bacterium]|nr:aldehyde ferredoxin oxidoreductase [Bacteroidales bacterium]